jgi:prepilin-type N-terminal cleavage/methylation domain-containing protein
LKTSKYSKETLKNTRISNQGFTLIELLVAIAILSILAMIALPNVIGFIDSAKVSADQASVRTLNSVTALMRISTNASDPFLDETNDSQELFDVLIDGGYLKSVVQPQTSNSEFVWVFEQEAWYLMFEDSFYVVKLSDGFVLETLGYYTGRLIGSYTGDSKDLVIPSSINGISINRIWQDSFNNKGLVAVDFDDDSNIQQIHARAFLNNDLTSIDLPNTLRKVDYGSFKDNQLTEIKLPPSLNQIETQAFDGNDLTKITIGATGAIIVTRALGEHTEKFKAAYSTGGSGTYSWNGTNWIRQ